MLMNLASSRNSHLEAVVKSVYRVPTPMTTSASLAISLAAEQPVTPTPPKFRGWSQTTALLPAWVSAKGMPVVSANFLNSSWASL